MPRATHAQMLAEYDHAIVHFTAEMSTAMLFVKHAMDAIERGDDEAKPGELARKLAERAQRLADVAARLHMETRLREGRIKRHARKAAAA